MNEDQPVLPSGVTKAVMWAVVVAVLAILLLAVAASAWAATYILTHFPSL